MFDTVSHSMVIMAMAFFIHMLYYSMIMTMTSVACLVSIQRYGHTQPWRAQYPPMAPFMFAIIIIQRFTQIYFISLELKIVFVSNSMLTPRASSMPIAYEN